MKPLKEALGRLLRGPRVSALLARAGIDSRRFWLLYDLFALLSERGEMMDQLGRNGVALDTAVLLYCGLSALFTVILMVTGVTWISFLSFFLVFTAFLLLSVLMSETGNSLVNPVEGMVLAHQPVDGATYTAAKLSHLASIILYLVPALNGIPALAGLFLKESQWYYPIIHLGAAFVVGLVEALLCCAVFGWLIRFLPVRRLKMAGQLAGALPFMAMPWMGQVQRLLPHLDARAWLPAQPALRWSIAAACGITMLAAVVLGIRSLSADYLLRVSGLMRGGASAGSHTVRSPVGNIVGRFFGGPAARAGFAFVSRMMLRDWQFRRQAIAMVFPLVFGIVAMVKSGLPPDPFVRHFTPIHLFPHLIATLLFLVCTILPYGGDYKGAWIFLLAPSRVIGGFAWGVYALLWISAILIPHLVLLPVFAWLWGVPHAALFIAYSAAAASSYLAVEMRLIEEVPFSRQVDPSRGAMLLPLMIGGGIIISIIVGLQYYFVFRSPAIVAGVTVVLAIAAWFVTRASVGAVTASMRFHLGNVSTETGSLYKEIV